MNRHPYLRAYMAGIALPTMVLLVAIVFFAFYRATTSVPIKVERMIIFPMALVPNLWGLWNILYVKVRSRYRLPIGIYGAVLIFILTPLGYAIQRGLDIMVWTPATFVIGLPVALLVYYLAWKHVVRFFNEVVGVA
jgi:hypothetical protein